MKIRMCIQHSECQFNFLKSNDNILFKNAFPHL